MSFTYRRMNGGSRTQVVGAEKLTSPMVLGFLSTSRGRMQLGRRFRARTTVKASFEEKWWGKGRKDCVLAGYGSMYVATVPCVIVVAVVR